MTIDSNKAAEDLYETFKTKVNEAIFLVQHLPETWQLEALKFWKEVTRTVEKLGVVYTEKEVCTPQDVATFLHFDNTFDDVIDSSPRLNDAKVNTPRVNDTSNVIITWPSGSTVDSIQEVKLSGGDTYSAVSFPPQSHVSDTESENTQGFQLDVSAVQTEPYNTQAISNNKDISNQIEVLVLNSNPLRELHENEDVVRELEGATGKGKNQRRQKKKPKRYKKDIGENDSLSLYDDSFTSKLVQTTDIQNQVASLETNSDNVAMTSTNLEASSVMQNTSHSPPAPRNLEHEKSGSNLNQSTASDDTKENEQIGLPDLCNEMDLSTLNTPEFENNEKSNNGDATDHDYVVRRLSKRKRKLNSKYKDMVHETSGEVVSLGIGEVVGSRRRERQPKPESFPCNECGANLSSATALQAHSRRHNGERPFSCTGCGKNFTTKGNLLRHVKSHIGEKPHQCSVCYKSFSEKRTLEVHMRTHTGVKPYKCSECSMSFSQSGVLKTHMYTHTGHKGHLCDYCGKAFRQKSQLRIHRLRHENKRSFKCETCDASFITRGDLQRHQLRHTNERPFSCSLCPKTFTRKQYLKEHMNIHNGQKPYFCKSCGMSFPDMSNYYRHMKKHKIKLKKEEEQLVQVEECAINNSVHNEVDNTEITTFNLNGDNEEIRIHFSESDLNMNLTPEQVAHQAANETTSEVYEVTEVDGNSIHSNGDQSTQLIITTVDFSAINLLANATTQFTLP